MFPIPPSLANGVGSTPAGAQWIRTVPERVSRAVSRWQLTLDEPFGVGTAAWTAPGTMGDGTPIVLKITYPHDEATHEATALRLWQGRAAVELLDQDGADWALLLRRAHPGTPMVHHHSPVAQRLHAGLMVLANLHTAPLDEQLPDQYAICATWASLAAARAARWRHLYAHANEAVEWGIDLLRAFATPGAMPGPRVLLHGDLNPGNIVLDAPGTSRGHWLAIDPKPMVGDPGYDLWPFLSQLDQPLHYPDPLAELAARAQLAEDLLHIPVRRTVERALARSVEGLLWKWDTWPEKAHAEHAHDDLLPIQIWAALLAE